MRRCGWRFVIEGESEAYTESNERPALIWCALSSHFIRIALRWITENVVEFLNLAGVTTGLLQAFQEMFDNEDLQR
jgi:hypothetical protein